MELFKAPPEMRIFLAALAVIVWIGILHTGLGTASWVLYIPGIFLPFAAATGLCPGLAFSRLIYGQIAGKEKPGPA